MGYLFPLPASLSLYFLTFILSSTAGSILTTSTTSVADAIATTTQSLTHDPNSRLTSGAGKSHKNHLGTTVLVGGNAQTGAKPLKGQESKDDMSAKSVSRTIIPHLHLDLTTQSPKTGGNTLHSTSDDSASAEHLNTSARTKWRGGSSGREIMIADGGVDRNVGPPFLNSSLGFDGVDSTRLWSTNDTENVMELLTMGNKAPSSLDYQASSLTSEIPSRLTRDLPKIGEYQAGDSFTKLAALSADPQVPANEHGNLETSSPQCNDTDVCPEALTSEALADAVSDEETGSPVLSRCPLGPEASCRGRCGEHRSMPCSCHVSCRLTGHCCPDFGHQCPQTLPPELLRLVPVSTGCLHDHLLVVSCDAALSHTEDGQRCASGRITEVSDMVPVTDAVSGFSFRNVHCARCHGVADDDVVTWQADMACTSTPGTVADLLSDCSFRFHGPPAPLFSQACFTSTPFMLLYSGCPAGTPALLAHRCRDAPTTYLARNFTVRNAFVSFVKLHLFKNAYCHACSVGSIPFEPVTECPSPVGLDILLNRPRNSGNFLLLMNWRVSGNLQLFYPPEESTPLTKVRRASCNKTHACKVDECAEGFILKDDDCLVEAFKLQFRITLSYPFGPPPHDGALFYSIISFFQENDLFSTICPDINSSHSNVFKGESETEAFQTFMIVLDCSRKRHVLSDAAFLAMAADLAARGLEVASAEEVGDLLENLSDLCVRELRDICLSPQNWTRLIAETSSGFDPLVVAERYVTLVACSLSIVTLCIRLLLQPFIPHYHSVPGKIQFTFAFTLTLAYVSFLAGAEVPQEGWVCWALAVTTHALFLASFFWMNVLIFWIWRSMSLSAFVSHTRSAHGSFFLSCFYCVAGPAALVGVAVGLDLYLPDSVLSPRYSRPGCWINNGWALLALFVGPVCLICLCNIILVGLTLRQVRQLRMPTDSRGSWQTVDVKLGGRLTSLTGVTWLLGLAAGLSDWYPLWLVFTVVNGSQGLAIGLVLLLTRQNYLLARSRFSTRQSTQISGQT